MTTYSSAIVPFVHQSFSPLSVQNLPSLDGVAVVLMFAGSLPTCTSVSANAVIAVVGGVALFKRQTTDS